MKRQLVVVVCAAWMAAAAVPASAQNFTFRALATGGQEVPPVQNGTWADVQCVLNFITGVTCNVRVVNLAAGATGAHIHVGSPGVNGPVVCDAGVTPNLSNDFTFGFACGPENFITDQPSGIGSFEDFVETFSGSQTYFNLHSPQYPGGAVRGWIPFTRNPPAANALSQPLLGR